MSNPQAHELPPLTKEIDLTPIQRRTARKSVAGSALGNAIEWFDYGIYGYLVTYMSANFFTFGDNEGALPTVLAFLTFAVSFLVRPLGGIILGPLGDRIGRQKVLVVTVLLISVASALIGVLPTFDQIGYWAPILLVLLRMLQGFSAGGEYAGAAVFMSEHAPDNRRGLYGSFLEFGTLAGASAAAILCTTLISIVGDDGMLAFWWRVPFWVTLLLGAVALWIRSSLQESETFKEGAAQDDAKSAWQSLGQLFTRYPLQVLKLFGFVILINVAFYIVLTYLPSYLSTTLGQDSAAANWTLVAIQVLMMVVIAPIGALSDRIGRKPVLIAASLGFTLLSIPAVMILQQGTVWANLLGIGILGLCLVAVTSTISSTMPALFPTSVRYSGFAIGYNFSTAIFGGTAGAMNTWLVEATGNPLVPGFYLCAAGVIGVLTVLTFHETAGRSLRGNVIPGSDDHLRVAAGEQLVGQVNKPQ